MRRHLSKKSGEKNQSKGQNQYKWPLPKMDQLPEEQDVLNNLNMVITCENLNTLRYKDTFTPGQNGLETLNRGHKYCRSNYHHCEKRNVHCEVLSNTGTCTCHSLTQLQICLTLTFVRKETKLIIYFIIDKIYYPTTA